MRIDGLRPAFVTEIPESIEPGVLYLALEYDVMVHLCACGCGNEVATPISPTDWRIAWDGIGMTVRPSIGNGALRCRSHYVIDAGRIKWFAPMSDHGISAERARTAKAKGLVVNPPASESQPTPAPQSAVPITVETTWTAKLWRWISRK